jgi:hypothetical protein
MRLIEKNMRLAAALQYDEIRHPSLLYLSRHH